MTKRMTAREFVANSNQCPACGSDNVDWGSHEVLDSSTYQEASCSTCGARFSTVSRLVGYLIHGDAEPQTIREDFQEVTSAKEPVDPACDEPDVNKVFWAGAEKGPHGETRKTLMVPTYDENGGPEKEYDWARPAQLTLQEEGGLRVIMGDPLKESSPDVVIEKTPNLWRIFVHHDGGDPLCYIEFSKARAFIFVDEPGGTKTLLVEERVVEP